MKISAQSRDSEIVGPAARAGAERSHLRMAGAKNIVSSSGWAVTNKTVLAPAPSSNLPKRLRSDRERGMTAPTAFIKTSTIRCQLCPGGSAQLLTIPKKKQRLRDKRAH